VGGDLLAVPAKFAERYQGARMRSNWLAAFAGGASVALLATVALWQLSRPRNYEECMLQEMLGQAASMHVIANRLCSRRFGIEFGINLATTFTWEPEGDVVRISVTEPKVCRDAGLFPLLG
jgi:hypothetical protein